MKYLPGAQQMKQADQYTIEHLGIPSLELMERAAKSCVACMKEKKMDMSEVCIVCGCGNNGGDGFAVGRLLLKEAGKVTAVMAGDESRCTKECRWQMEQFQKAGGKICNDLPEGEYSIIADALFGVGLSRKIEGKYARIIDWMNAGSGLKFALDIPSGISSDTGEVLGTAFRADVTVTFQTEKFGIKVYPGKTYAGEIIDTDIGISTGIWERDEEVCGVLEEREYARMLPERKEDSNKGTFGKVLVIAGSKGMSGAAYFNAKAAYRAGAGLVQIYTPEDNRMILQQQLPEAIVTAYEDFEEEKLRMLLQWADVICIGSGIGQSDRACRILRTTLEYGTVPTVIDADGLNLLSGIKHYEKLFLHKDYILTPHMKEMSRLTGLSVEDLKRNRREVLCDFTEKTEVICVLKDSCTLTGMRGKRPMLNSSGNSAMAKAGAGDVLAGVITAFLAQGLDCRSAAVLGAYIHGKAGDIARDEKGCYSVIAEDLVSYTGEALRKLQRRKGEIQV